MKYEGIIKDGEIYFEQNYEIVDEDLTSLFEGIAVDEEEILDLQMMLEENQSIIDSS